MKIAINEAQKGILAGDGGPFGAVVVKDGKVISKGHNRVIANNDPTCHGEIEALRKAGKKLKTFDLSDCEIYTTAEPCPMCFCAILWANISKVYFGCNVTDTQKIGFRDKEFEEKMKDKCISTYVQIDKNECLKLFQNYSDLKNKINY